MVHKALKIPESRLPPLLVRRLFGSTFLAVLPFISVRPSRRREAQAEGLLRPYKSVIYSVAGYGGSRSLQWLAGRTTLFLHLYFVPVPRILPSRQASRKSINVSAVLLRRILY